MKRNNPYDDNQSKNTTNEDSNEDNSEDTNKNKEADPDNGENDDEITAPTTNNPNNVSNEDNSEDTNENKEEGSDNEENDDEITAPTTDILSTANSMLLFKTKQDPLKPFKKNTPEIVLIIHLNLLAPEEFKEDSYVGNKIKQGLPLGNYHFGKQFEPDEMVMQHLKKEFMVDQNAINFLKCVLKNTKIHVGIITKQSAEYAITLLRCQNISSDEVDKITIFSSKQSVCNTQKLTSYVLFELYRSLQMKNKFIDIYLFANSANVTEQMETGILTEAFDFQKCELFLMSTPTVNSYTNYKKSNTNQIFLYQDANAEIFYCGDEDQTKFYYLGDNEDLPKSLKSKPFNSLQYKDDKDKSVTKVVFNILLQQGHLFKIHKENITPGNNQGNIEWEKYLKNMHCSLNWCDLFLMSKPNKGDNFILSNEHNVYLYINDGIISYYLKDEGKQDLLELKEEFPWLNKSYFISQDDPIKCLNKELTEAVLEITSKRKHTYRNGAFLEKEEPLIVNIEMKLS